jgi:predicted transcriptional regulator
MSYSAIERINLLLKKANFETFQLDSFFNKQNKFCFDLLVKKEDTIFSVKLFPNIDNLNPNQINDLKTLSILLKSKPLLIGIRNRYQKLEKNAVYMREGLPFISIETLESILEKNEYPHILARRGGGVIFLDGNLLKDIREKKSISRKELSEQLGVTKRTIFAYENDNMRTSEKIAKILLEILGNHSIFRKLNPLDWKISYELDQHRNTDEVDLNEFESHVQYIMKDIGLCTYWYNKGPIPFKLSLYSENEDENFFPLFSGISEEQKRITEKNIQCLKMFTRVFHKNCLFIINNNIKISEEINKNIIPIVKIKDLEKVNDEEEFIELVQGSTGQS